MQQAGVYLATWEREQKKTTHEPVSHQLAADKIELHKLWDVLIQGLGPLDRGGFVNIMTLLTFFVHHCRPTAVQNNLFDIGYC